MKKTFSLKLMLVGLLCSMGMSAWADSGDIFTDEKLVLLEENGGATVIGVASHDGTIIIPDQVKNGFANNKPLKIKKLATNWYDGGTLVLFKDGGETIAGSSVCENLKNGGQFNLKIEATQLKKDGFTTEAIQPLWDKVKSFELTSAAGLDAIPDYAFANVGTKEVTAGSAQAIKEKENEIKALEALKEVGVADRTNVPVIVGGKISTYCYNRDLFGTGDGSVYAYLADNTNESGFVGKQVYKLLTNQDGNDISTAGIYVILGKQVGVDEAKNMPLYELLQINGKGGDMNQPFYPFAAIPDLKVRASADPAEGMNKLVDPAHDVYAAEAFTGDVEGLVYNKIFGLESLKQMAEAAYMTLLQPKNDFDAMVEDVSVYISHYDNYNTEPLQTAAAVKRKLMQAERKKNDAKAEWDKGQLVVGENFWNSGNVSYIITNAVREVAPTMTREQVLAKDFSIKEDYTDMAGARKLRSEKLDGENMSELDRVMRIVAKMAEAGFTQIEEVVSGETIKKGYEKPSFQGLEQAKYDTQVAYLAALDMWNDVIAYNNGEPATKMVDGEETPIQKITVDTSGNPSYSDTDRAQGLTYAQLEAAIEEARLAKEAATTAFNNVNDNTLLNKLKDELANLKKTSDVLDYTKLGENGVLKTVIIESAPALTTIGKYAFYGCKDAVLNGTAAKLPTTLTTIKEHAFNYAAQANPVFTTLKNLAEIGEYAFAYSGATNGDFRQATKLEKFGTNVFDNCKLTNLLLKGTPLKAIPGKLAYAGMIDTDQDGKVDYTEGVYLENAKFVDACGYFHNYDVNKAEDVAALKALGFKDTEIKAVNVAGSLNGGEAWVNTTLTETSLPEAITVVPDQAYYNCINLATLTGGVPAGVTEIGDYAFYRTKIAVFDLRALDKLTEIGVGAFGGNSELTTVKLPTAAAEGVAGVTSLPEDVFECDSKLSTIILNPEISCLAPGLFANTAIRSLDLSNTQVTVLPDLFMNTEITNPEAQTRWKAMMAENPNSVFNTLTTITLPETVLKETTTQNWAAGDAEIPGLQIIGNRAFEQLQGITRMTIPSSVWAMGEEVFAYCKNLRTVTAMDSRLTNLGNKTFRNCSNLTSVTFVTLAVIDPAWKLVAPGGKWHTSCGDVAIGGLYNFDDTQFFNCPKIPTITVTPESYEIVKGQYFKSYAEEYSKLKKFQPTITLTDNGTNFSDTYYNEFYGTWIKCDEADVYTAYQNVNEMILYKAKRHNNYYKIPALNQKPIVMSDAVVDGRPFAPLNPGSQIIHGEIPESESTTPWVSKGENQKNVFWYTGYDSPVSIPEGSPAVIIIAKKAKINVERHSLPGEKFQSTLDRDNELRIAGTTINTDNTSNLCVWATDYETQHTFYILNDTEYIIPKGKVVFPLGAWQGTANGRLNVTIVDSDVTGIMGVKDYVKSLNDSEAIYNLQGVRVTAPVKGQMYIQAGKKFIQK